MCAALAKEYGKWPHEVLLWPYEMSLLIFNMQARNLYYEALEEAEKKRK